MHIANIGSRVNLFDDEIVDHLLIRCRKNANNELSTLSFANLEILSDILSSVASQSDMTAVHAAGCEVLKEVKARLISIANNRAYKHFLAIIRNLTLIDVYDVELMDNLFHDRFLTFMHDKKHIPDLNLYFIDGYNRINLKHIYGGAVLPDKYLSKIIQVHLLSPNKTSVGKWMPRVKKISAGLFQHFYWGYVLPFHLSPGTVFNILTKRFAKFLRLL